jgi:predicted nuclease of predicted toxin-antitoxin system
MAERLFIALYLDENVPMSAATNLRSRGHDATTAQEAGLKGASDDQQMAFAIQSNRTLVTSNVRHFLAIFRSLHSEHRSHPGLILVTRPMSVGELVQALLRLLDQVTADEMRDQVAFLSDYIFAEEW